MTEENSVSASQGSAPGPMKVNIRIIIMLSAIMALQMTSFAMIMPLLAPRFSEFGAGVKALGLSEMIYALAATLAAPWMGALADRFGRKPVVLCSLVAYVLAYIGFLFAPTVALFIVVRGFTGAFTAGLFPAVTGMAADLSPANRRAQWIGFITGGASIGYILGPVAGGVIYDHWGYRIAIIISIIMASITLIIAFAFVSESRLVSDRSVKPGEPQAADGIFHRIRVFLLNFLTTLPRSLSTFLILLFIYFAVIFVWAFILPPLMFYAYNDLGWSSSMFGLLLSVYGIAMVVGVFGFGRLSDRLGRKPVILCGLILFSSLFIGLVFFRSYYLVLAVFAIAGMGNALYDPALSASLLDISPPEHRARILGLKSMAGSAGNILGPALVSAFNSSAHALTIFLIASGMMVFTTLIVLVDLVRHRFSGKVLKSDLGRNLTLGL